IGRTVPLAPAGGKLRRVLTAVAVEELAEVHGVVAAALEPDGKRVGLVERLVAALGWRVSAHAVVVRVLPGQKRRTRRAAERERIEVVVERHALVPDQALDVRQHLHLSERLVVGLENEDVRSLRRWRRLCGAAVLTYADRESHGERQHRRDCKCLPASHRNPPGRDSDVLVIPARYVPTVETEKG